MDDPLPTRNLDRRGAARDVLVADSPTADLTFFVATARPDGRASG